MKDPFISIKIDLDFYLKIPLRSLVTLDTSKNYFLILLVIIQFNIDKN